MRLALFGGTFDPIHDAHLAVARAAADRFALDRVRFIPAGRPPHKEAARAPYACRLRMAELACAADARFEVSRLEEGDRQSYSIDTIQLVRAGLGPADDLFFLIGADAFAEVHTWRRWREVLDAVEFIVVSRPGHLFHAPPGARVHRLDGLDLAVSSTAIRAAIRERRTAIPAPAAVLDYIRSHALYGA